MSVNQNSPAELEALHPRLKVLLGLYRAAGGDARPELERAFERLFLETAWHIARDLLDNGYEPAVTNRALRGPRSHLRLVDDIDAA